MTDKKKPVGKPSTNAGGGGIEDENLEKEIFESGEEKNEETKDESELSEKEILMLAVQELRAARKENAILNEKIHQMNANLVAGYKATEQVLKVNLEPLAQIGRQAQAQQAQQPAGAAQIPVQMMGGGNGQGFVQQQPSGMGNQYYRPNGGQMQGNFDPSNAMAVMEFLKMFMQPDPSQSMFAQLGQRMFAEMVTTNMLTQRSMVRRLANNNLLTKEEVDTYEQMQNKLYQPLLGGGQPNGQPSGNQQPPQSPPK